MSIYIKYIIHFSAFYSCLGSDYAAVLLGAYYLVWVFSLFLSSFSPSS